MDTIYDIFISYRKKCSGDKPEMLQLMLEENGFRGRVSFDKDNLNGQFDIELLRRIDTCKDFIMMAMPETFNGIDAQNEEDTQFYTRLANMPYDEFSREVRQASKTRPIDFVRIELGRALKRAEKGELNIVPIAPLDSPGYSFDSLDLPPDLSDLVKFQAVFYSEARQARFKDILPDLLRMLSSRPKENVKRLPIFIAAIVLLVCGIAFVTNYLSGKQARAIAFAACKTKTDFEEFVKAYPNTFEASRADSILAEFSRLKNDGRAYVCNTADENVRMTDKKTVDVVWSPKISINQLRTMVEMLDRMIKIDTSDALFDMGIDGGKGYDAPKHKVRLTQDFYICQYEVTRGWWYSVMKDSLVTDSVNYPMTNMTYDDAESFAKKVAELTGLSFSLPSEAQWEWAAVGNAIYKFSGDDDARNVAWFNVNSDGLVHEVGQKNANDNELYDMSGNVAEWCCDYMSRYSGGLVENPVVTDNPGHGKRVVRGGSFLTNERDLNVRHRAVQSEDIATNNVGFRVIFQK